MHFTFNEQDLDQHFLINTIRLSSDIVTLPTSIKMEEKKRGESGITLLVTSTEEVTRTLGQPS